MTRPIISGCATSKYPKLAYNDTTWSFLRESYRLALGETGSIDASSFEESFEEGFEVDYEVRNYLSRGRGIYVTEPVELGELIYYVDYDHAEFPDERTFQNFLERLPFSLQCEIILWAYVEGSSHEGYRVAVELNDGSFINHGEITEEINAAEINISCDGLCALRDIEAGEQILMNYSKFIVYDALDWFDNIRSMAWRENALNGTSCTADYNSIGTPINIYDDKVPISDLSSTGLLKFVLLILFSLTPSMSWKFSNK